MRAGLSKTERDRSGLRDLSQITWGPALAGILLCLIGLATVHSASVELPGNHAARQALWIVLALAVGVFCCSLDYRTWIRLSPIFYLFALGLLVAVLFVGREAGGATSWLDLGPVSLQPSELAKLATALLLARWLGNLQQPRLRISQIGYAALLTGVPAVLVVLERDLGNAVMFVPIVAGMLLVAGVRWRVIVTLALLAILAGGLAWNFALLDYQKERVLTFLHPERDPLGAGYQLRQSKIAVGSGEVLGRGYLQGTQSQLRFLPARHTDFIFAVLAEEWGFVGVCVALSLYAWYVVSGGRIARRARDRAGVLLAVGLLSGFAFHVLYNTAMVIGLMPITGVPLPFLSYGGSFMVVNGAATGLLLGIDARRHANR